MGASQPPAADAARDPSTRKSRTGKLWVFGRGDIVPVLLVLNLVGLIGLGLRVYRGDRPTIVTVGITQLAREYMAKLAASNVSPAEARVRTQMFLAVAQDAVKQAAGRRGIIVVPRECILAGEFSDMTAEVSKAVSATMDGRPLSTPAVAVRSELPLEGLANVDP
jgi:hypothetical protein